MQCEYCGSFITPYPANGICPNCCAVLPPDDTPKPAPQPPQRQPQPVYTAVPGLHCCPRCGAGTITSRKRGFRWGLAVLGLFLLPPFGLLFGLIGRKTILFRCKNCAYKWKR